MSLKLDPAITKSVQAMVSSQLVSELPKPVISKSTSVLEQIEQTHVLRVGFMPDAYPFSYFNTHHQLVGLDVAYMYHLAKDLGVRLAFIPYQLQNVMSALSDQKIDIAIGGLFVTERRLKHAMFSSSYEVGRFALIVPDTLSSRYQHYDEFKDQKLSVGVRNDAFSIRWARRHFINAHLVRSFAL